MDDEYNKLTVVCCYDARVAIAFTGLALISGLDMSTWLTERLVEIDRSGIRTLPEILECLREHLDKLFNSLRGEFKLTVVICGFTYWEAEPSPCIYKISNFEFESYTPLRFTLGVCPTSADGSVEVAGATDGFPHQTIETLANLLRAQVPRQSIVRYAVRHLQTTAKSFRSAGTVGERCNSAVIPAPCNMPITSTYHVPKNTNQAFGCNVVIFEGMWSLGVNLMAPYYLAGQEIRKKDPCWCGSGELFKHCHLKKSGAVEVRHHAWQRPLNWVVEIERQEPVASGKLFRLQSGYS